MAELGDSFGLDQDVNVNGIQVEMLDYEYIEQCNDIKILKGIISVLQSGKEGYYPDVSNNIKNLPNINKKNKKKI